MNIQRQIEATPRYIRWMMAWCRENRLPLIYGWLIVKNWDFDAGWQWYGSRAFPFPTEYDDEEISFTFWIRERDLDLWLLRFK